MATQPFDLSLCDVVLIDDPFEELRDAALFGPNYIFLHNLQTRRQRFPHGLRMTDFPQWFEAKRTFVPHQPKVSRLEVIEGTWPEREFTPVHVAPENALLGARRILVSTSSTRDLEARRPVRFMSNIPNEFDDAFGVGQSPFHVLQDFYIACAETTPDPAETLRTLVGKTEVYSVRRVYGSGGFKDEESLDLPPAMMLDREQFLMELLARRLEERFFWNWKLHAIVASRRGLRDLEWHERTARTTRWEDGLANPFLVQMLYRIRARQSEGFPVSEVRPWEGTGRYDPEDLPQHWRVSVVRPVMRAVEDKTLSDEKVKRGNRRGKATLFDSASPWMLALHDEFEGVKFKHFGLTEWACEFLAGLHPDCEDIDLPLRLIEWRKEPNEAAEAAMARYLRTWFGKLLRHRQPEREATPA